MGALDFGRVAPLPPLALLSQALPRLTRHELESVVELLIDRLDAVDGDTDIEPNGDELDGTGAEDCFSITPNPLHGPGCPVSDPDYCEGSDDRGTIGPNAHFQGYDYRGEVWQDEDRECESWPELVN